MDDLIRRQDAINELVRWGKIPDYNDGEKNVIGCVIGMLSALPPAQTERKKGEWEEKTVLFDDLSIEQWQSARCSACGLYHTTPYSYYFYHYKYCPYCGAEMSQGEENEGN